MNLLQKTLSFFITVLVLFTAVIYFDNNHQKASITAATTKQIQNDLPNIPNAYTATEDEKKHLQSIGFSDYAISNLTSEEAAYYLTITGELIESETYYEEQVNTKSSRVKEKEYFRLLNKRIDKNILNDNALFQTKYSLYQISEHQFFAISEIRVDYASKPLEDTILTTQLHPLFEIHNQYAKQTWWKSPLLQKQNDTVYSKSYVTPTGHTFDEENDYVRNESDHTYQITWSKPELFEDIIGAHFFYTAIFSIPDDHAIADIYFQVDNPDYSLQLSNL